MSIRIFLLFCFTAAVLFCAPASYGALKAYLQIAGENQGNIDGEVEDPGHEDSIMVIGFSHEVVSPRDPTSGLPTGLRSHQPVKIIKTIDKASPKLADALDNNERMTTFNLEFIRLDGMGLDEQYYIVQLEDARIVGIRQSKLNILDPENAWAPDMETVWLTYSRITWTYEPDAITSDADWDFEPGPVPRISDLNYDGNTNLLDLAVLADQWLQQ